MNGSHCVMSHVQPGRNGSFIFINVLKFKWNVIRSMRDNHGYVNFYELQPFISMVLESSGLGCSFVLFVNISNFTCLFIALSLGSDTCNCMLS